MSGLPTPDEYWLPDPLDMDTAGRALTVEYATVIQLTAQGEPILQFPRETLPSPKTYRRMKSYAPMIGDRVQLIDGTIMGAFWTSAPVKRSGFANAGRLSAAAFQSTTLAAGIYTNAGDGLLAADGSVALSGWWHVIVMNHTDNNGYGAQIAVPLSPGGTIHWRHAIGTTWSEWVDITGTA
jgi:hypothetical protein